MNLNDWLTLIAIVLGPLSAVLVTLLIETLRRRKERRLYIVRMLLTTRHIPADAQYNAAINLIPAEFHKRARVMAAWRTYHDRVRERPSQRDKADYEKRLTAAQSALIFQVMQ